jgi:toxin-antitoxin system PIN domain toxin
VTALLDANVLIALIVVDHVHHQAAERWLASWAGTFATCPITQGSLVRLLVREGLSIASAVDTLRALEDDSRHEFWADDLPFTEVLVHGVLGHRQVTDAYLAQLARRRQGRLVTFDQALAALHRDVADAVR